MNIFIFLIGLSLINVTYYYITHTQDKKINQTGEAQMDNAIFLIALFLFLTNTTNAVANVKTQNTEKIYTDVERQEQRLNLKMTRLNISKEEVILSENLRAVTLEMDKNNTLSTWEILGIFADTPAEKRKYARKFVESIRNYTTQVLEFQKYIKQAHNEMAVSNSMFDYLPPNKSVTTKRKRKTVDLDNCDELCEGNIKTLLKSALIFPVDLYFKNATGSKIQRWALKMKINHNEVKQGLITLNYAR
jgi:integrating conjugative element protein (TIGR03759 family)